MRLKLSVLLAILFLAFSFSAYAQAALKVGFINMNKAINESNEGKRSKKFLESQFAKTKQDLDKKKAAIEEKERELANSMMLTEETKKAKRQEIQRLKKDLAEEAKRMQKSFRQDEARHTKNILQDILSVVKTVAAADEYDVVLEYNMSQAILYSKYPFKDITEKVILEYNKLQNIQ